MRSSLLVLAALLAALTAPRAPAQKADAAAEAKPVTLTVVVPQEDATLTIEGQKTRNSNKLRRDFISPPLKPGTKYIYTLTCVWAPNNYTHITRTHEVEVVAGADVEVDMTKAQPKHPDAAKVRWVPTPDDVVEELVKLAKIGPDDVVFEPGSGDGRMVIAAVKKGKAKRAVGIDIDPEKVKEARENVKAAGVEKEVEIREGDALKIKDLSDANVVMLYMGNEFNMLLRPILLKHLKPGARVVSHRFTMGDWKPDKSITVTGKDDGDDYHLHLWIIPEPKK
jgi:uncharacterized protein (TIGR03000 family)